MIAEFLEALWGLSDGYGELRLITQGDGVVRQGWYQLSAEGIAAAAHRATSEGTARADTYFGVLPRVRQGGKADDVVDFVSWLWADVDAKQFHAGDVRIGKALALGRLNDFVIPPQMLVDSGGGYHLYWHLDRPQPYVLARSVMEWIADVLQGDRVQDKPRVLRVPGTINWKREPVVQARLLKFDLMTRYRLSDFEGLMPPPPRRFSVLTGQFTRTELPAWLDELVEQGAPKGQRSETCFRAMLWLLRYGRTPDEIKDIFRATPDGIGAKYAEKSTWDGERWLDLTLNAAMEVA